MQKYWVPASAISSDKNDPSSVPDAVALRAVMNAYLQDLLKHRWHLGIMVYREDGWVGCVHVAEKEDAARLILATGAVYMGPQGVLPDDWQTDGAIEAYAS